MRTMTGQLGVLGYYHVRSNPIRMRAKKHWALALISSPDPVTQTHSHNHKSDKCRLHAAFNPLRPRRNAYTGANSSRCGVHDRGSDTRKEPKRPAPKLLHRR